MALKAVLFFLCVVGLSACSNAETSACLDSWQRRASTLAPCVPGPVCTQLAAEPQSLASFAIGLAGDAANNTEVGTIPEAQRLANWNCLAGALGNRGVKTIEPYESSSNVVVTATWDQIQDVREFVLVTGVEARR